jgi:hypothetical protein
MTNIDINSWTTRGVRDNIRWHSWWIAGQRFNVKSIHYFSKMYLYQVLKSSRFPFPISLVKAMKMDPNVGANTEWMICLPGYHSWEKGITLAVKLTRRAARCSGC